MEANLKVKLLAHTENPERIIATAAKLCYSSSDIEHIHEGLDAEKTESFIQRLMDLGHESPTEHVTFTFGIEGVSRALLAQITRHRIASYSVKSQRYVTEGQFQYIVPPAIKDDEVASKKYIETMEYLQKQYDDIAEILKKKYVDGGMAEKAAEKLAIEDARFVLPNACETKIVMTFNARSLMNMFHHRCCERAQWEIRAMADEMLKLVKEVAPTLFKYAGPPCVSGPCPEGKMSCGKMKEKREKYLC
ncbi:MAG: FAD-dependent thymidylate synthase [Clostridia bacterium]|nr:FAD-dependent thymidylate synthase [Clostridia bacterium]